MQKKSVLFTTFSILISSLFTSVAHADIEWSGLYRIEANNFKNLELDGRQRELNYGLSHLILRPKIVAGDGLTIQAQFHIFNSSDYPNSQLGQAFGSGVRGSTPDNTTGARGSVASNDGSNTMSRNQRAETISVSQLYLTYTQEYGQLILGRIPIQFGLGMRHSGGRGLFDHWYDSDDVVAYKIVMGNLSFMPMLGRQSEGNFNESDDLTDYMAQLMYENPESEVQLGIFYKERHGGALSADAGTASFGGTGTTQTGNVATKEVNLFVQKETENYRVGVEAGFLNGSTGNVRSDGASVDLDAYGISAEFDYTPKTSKWNFGGRAGYASGDNPDTANKFEGYIFNRNYNVGMLLFNMPMGRADFLRTDSLRGNVYDGNNSIRRPDVDAVSNVIYFSPNFSYALSDRWKVKNTFVGGWLAQNPLAGKNPGKQLGYEWDVSLSYSPRKGLMWINEVGMLFPGKAWEGDSQFTAGFAYGLSTKAAISF